MRVLIDVPHPNLLPQEAVSQRLKIGLSSRTNVRDLRFLPAVEMTEGPTGAMFPVLRRSLQGEKERFLNGGGINT